MELCYLNNPQSLFRKYNRLVTWFANTNLGRDYLKDHNFYIPNEKLGLFLPNGYIRLGTIGKDKIEAQLVVATNNCFERKLGVALTKLDIVNNWIKDFGEAKEILAWYLGLRHQPVFASRGWNILLDVSTFNPHSSDGYIRGLGNDVWATEHDAASGQAPAETNYAVTAAHYGTNNNNIYRSFSHYNTSALTASATITAGGNTLTLYNLSKGDDNGATIGVVQTTFADPISPVAGDYDQFGTTLAASATIASHTVSTTKVYTFNSTGDGWISKTGYTQLGLRCSPDYLNSEPAGVNYVEYTQGGGANAPILSVTYTIPATGAPWEMLLTGIGR